MPYLRGAAAIILGASIAVGTGPARAEPLGGFNVVAASGHPFGSEGAAASLRAARRTGARTVAIVPFLWQASPASPTIDRGSEMPDDILRKAIRQSRAAGFSVTVKPHVWVPESWAGAIQPSDEDGWRTWFEDYRRGIERIAQIAAAEGADSLAIGTELKKTTHRPEWRNVIASARRAFAGRILYVAHNLEEAETIPFWASLDAVGVTLYPPLGADGDREGRVRIMRETAERLAALSQRVGKPAVVGEIGLRSAAGAAAKPWESAEERKAAPDQALQADVIADWLAALDRPEVSEVLVWRWFTDPAAGGANDTDFTVQGKAAEAMLACAWARDCRAR